jgi:hypothetical protein
VQSGSAGSAATINLLPIGYYKNNSVKHSFFKRGDIITRAAKFLRGADFTFKEVIQ